MRTGRKTRVPSKKILFLTAGILIITVVIVMSMASWKRRQQDQEKVKQGVAYLSGLEKQDVQAIQEEIKVMKDARRLDLTNVDEAEIWSGFDNAVILGDSRAVGFSYYEFLPESQVLAEGGGRVVDVSQYLDQLKAMNPERIYLCYGLNDIEIGLWPEPSDYVEEYDRQMQMFLTELPNSTVYINSILPAVGNGLYADEDYVRIGEYNDALKKMAEEKGYHYIDNTILVEEHGDLYQEDGLHVRPEFYKYWAVNMLTGVDEQ